ncbi:tetratricopeptide repeat protein [Halanaerobium congolense]|jgi:tetratricopeptide (TPR) repeat protein|uniref:tetratricopeptide repeat protein n=1 Tax=Halanaerobium congolense TaxID=54121 RepID=UPI000880CE5A|nr:tetratricopeptide repeat protein [Halanaerobium congolense]SDH48583.1 Tetratricopeptide repeat-containing protein [Halanaerobium congolense]
MFAKIKSFIQKFKDNKSFRDASKKIDEGYFKEAEKILIEIKDSPYVEKEMLFFNLAGALIGQDKLKEGEKYLHKAVEVEAEQDYIWATLAEVNVLQRKWDEAEKAINKAIELEPDKSFYEIKKEVICGSDELKEDYLKHFALLKEAIEEQKNENWKKSVEILREAVEHYDRTGYVYNQIGAIYNNNLGNKELAAQFFKKAIEKEPDNKIFQKNLKHVLK